MSPHTDCICPLRRGARHDMANRLSCDSRDRRRWDHPTRANHDFGYCVLRRVSHISIRGPLRVILPVKHERTWAYLICTKFLLLQTREVRWVRWRDVGSCEVRPFRWHTPFYSFSFLPRLILMLDTYSVVGPLVGGVSSRHFTYTMHRRATVQHAMFYF